MTFQIQALFKEFKDLHEPCLHPSRNAPLAKHKTIFDPKNTKAIKKISVLTYKDLYAKLIMGVTNYGTDRGGMDFKFFYKIL